MEDGAGKAASWFLCIHEYSTARPPADGSADRWGLPVPAPHLRLTRIFRSDKAERLRLGHQNPERAPDAGIRGEKSRLDQRKRLIRSWIYFTHLLPLVRWRLTSGPVSLRARPGPPPRWRLQIFRLARCFIDLIFLLLLIFTPPRFSATFLPRECASFRSSPPRANLRLALTRRRVSNGDFLG